MEDAMKAGNICAALVAGSLAIGVGAAGAQSSGVSDGAVKIGVLTDMAGVFSDLGGAGAVTAAQMAIDDFVEKEKPPFKVELVSADHQNKPDIATGIARQWYDTGGVDLITDVINSGVALAVSSVAESKDRMLIVTGSGSTRLTNEQCSPNTISYTWDTYSFANGQSRIVKSLGLDTWYFVAVDYALGKSLVAEASGAIARSGGTVVGTVYHPISTTDLSSFLLQAQGSKAKVIGLANAGGDTINSIKQAGEFGITQAGQKLAGLLVFSSDIKALSLQTAQGLVLTESFYWDLNDGTREFSKRFAAKAGGKMPTMVQAGVYGAVLHYLKAVEATKSKDAAAVMAKMKEMPTDDPLFGKGIIRADGRKIHDAYLFEVKKPNESKGEWDLYKLISKIPGDQAFRPLDAGGCALVKKS
jgi:branched-chain amino acid transport system substrate-binding protein